MFDSIPTLENQRCLEFQSTSSVSAIGKDGLPSDPSTVGTQEANDRSDVLDHGETVTHAVCFVEFNGFRGLLGIEEGCDNMSH